VKFEHLLGLIGSCERFPSQNALAGEPDRSTSHAECLIWIAPELQALQGDGYAAAADRFEKSF
jgi:hypothetical protein